MPSDIVGTQVLAESDGRREFSFKAGPIFAHIVLGDEINRATPKTQSAVLEAMEEHQVTVFGTTYLLDAPFFVLATQNPIELEGTYPLPEAQMDRFLFKVVMGAPKAGGAARNSRADDRRDDVQGPIDFRSGTGAGQDRSAKGAGARGHGGRAGRALHHLDYRRVHAGRAERDSRGFAVPAVWTEPARGTIADHVREGQRAAGRPRDDSYEDVDDAIIPSLRHRLLRNFQAEAENVSAESILEQAVKRLKRPR